MPPSHANTATPAQKREKREQMSLPWHGGSLQPSGKEIPTPSKTRNDKRAERGQSRLSNYPQPAGKNISTHWNSPGVTPAQKRAKKQQMRLPWRKIGEKKPEEEKAMGTESSAAVVITKGEQVSYAEALRS
jgi:hypothetical protein